MIRRMTLRNVPDDLFGAWSGELTIDADGVAPLRCHFGGTLEYGFSRTGTLWRDSRSADVRACGEALNREIATIICKVRLYSWMTADGDWEEYGP